MMNKKLLKTRLLAGILSIVCILNSISLVASAEQSACHTVFSISNVSGKPGETVSLDISVSGDAEVSGLLLYGLTYDTSVFEFVEFNSFGTLVTNSVAGSDSVSSSIINLGYNPNIVPSGKICTAVFKIKEDAAEGNFSIGFSTVASSDNGKDVSSTISGGAVEVSKWMRGDFDDNGTIDMQDAVHFIGWVNFSYIPGLYSMPYSGDKDFNHDGAINMQDAVYLIGWINFSYIPGLYDIDWYGTYCAHSLQHVAAKPATCTEDGNIAYWYCENCEKYFSDEKGKTEITLEDTVIKAGHTLVEIPATEFMTSGQKCSECGQIIVEPQPIGGEYTIQYNVSMYNSNDPSEVAKIANDKYTSDKAKTLPALKMDTYTFIGWTDQYGRFFENNIIPVGTSGNLILKDNWVSQRNRAKAKAKLDDPLVVEDADNQMIYFGYEIGTIENVPLYTTQNLLCVNGVISVLEKTTRHNITAEEMRSLGSVISKETVDSTQTTLSKDLTAITETIKTSTEQTDEDTKRIENEARSQTNTHSYSSSSGGSSENYVYNDSTSRNSTNQSYVINKNLDTGFSHELQTGFKNTTEVSAGVSFPIEIVKVEAGAKNTTEISANTDTKFNVNSSVGSTGSWDNHTYNESYSANSSTNTKTWNTSSASTTANEASQSTTISNAFHEMIANTYHYGETYSESLGEENQRGLAYTEGTVDSSTQSIGFTKQEIISETRSFSSTGYTFGGYRLVMQGTLHVFAIVGYDVAKSEYFVYTYSVLGDGSRNDGWHEEIDYSYDRSFSDYENTVIPFEIPMYVEDYVNSRIVKTAGLEYEFDNKAHTAMVDNYSGTDKVVYVPSYFVDEEGTAYKVTSISSTAFKGNKNIVAVSLGKYVSTIPDSAFEGCENLEYIVCPAVTVIGDRAFYGCNNMKEFMLSAQISKLGVKAFDGVKSVVVDKSSPLKDGAVAEALAASGAKSITLDISGVPTDSKMSLQVANADTFVLEGGEKIFTNLTVKVEAENTRLESITLSAQGGVPVQLDSSNVTLYKFAITGDSSYAMLLAKDDVALALSGTNAISSSSEKGIVCNNVSVTYTNSGKLKMNGNILHSGTITDQNNRVTFDSGEYENISYPEYCKYKEGVFRLVFDPAEGSVETLYKEVVVGTPYGKLPIPTRQYYTFDGWYTADGDCVNEDTVLSIAEDVKLFAHWKRNTFTVTFDANGGNVQTTSQSVTQLEPYGALPLPTRDYYTFDGWYTEETGGNKVTAETIFDSEENVTLYAHWTVNSYTATWSTETGYTITVNRTSSPNKGAATGAISSGSTVYYGDVLSITYTANTGHSISSKGATSITVVGDVTSKDIYATAATNSYTYTIKYQSVNGTDLGLSSATYKFGTTNTITAPAKTGYTTPSSQSVDWDATSKTITFIYGIVSQATTQSAASGWWYKAGNYGLKYSATIQYQNRTATSIQIRVVWNQTIDKAAYGYNQWFSASCGEESTGSVKIASPSTWPYYSDNGPWHSGTVTAYSGWITVPVSATSTSVTVNCNWWADSDSSNGSWSKTIAIPAY